MEIAPPASVAKPASLLAPNALTVRRCLSTNFFELALSVCHIQCRKWFILVATGKSSHRPSRNSCIFLVAPFNAETVCNALYRSFGGNGNCMALRKFLLSKYYYSKFYEILVLSSKFSLRVSLEA